MCFSVCTTQHMHCLKLGIDEADLPLSPPYIPGFNATSKAGLFINIDIAEIPPSPGSRGSGTTSLGACTLPQTPSPSFAGSGCGPCNRVLSTDSIHALQKSPHVGHANMLITILAHVFCFFLSLVMPRQTNRSVLISTRARTRIRTHTNLIREEREEKLTSFKHKILKSFLQRSRSTLF